MRRSAVDQADVHGAAHVGDEVRSVRAESARRLDIIGLGEPMLEFSQTTDTAGVGDHYLQGFGGDTSNAVIAAARQGAAVGYWTRLGQDVFGDRLMELWGREGVEAGRVVRDPDAPTGIYFVTHGPAGHAFSYYRHGSAASLMRPADVPVEAIAAAKVLHVSGISQAVSPGACDAVASAIDVARAAGAGDTFDGAFLAEWVRGAALADATRYANAAAALSTRGYGAVGPIPRRAEVEAWLASRG